MTRLPATIHPDIWMAHIFAARAAVDGGIVRRKSADIDRIIGRDRFIAELNRRGFRAVENAGQTVIFCNREPVLMLR
ncbi:MAG: N-(5'-phosphoribosyl)anthranilate isomerase [Pseudomonadota bacterium]